MVVMQEIFDFMADCIAIYMIGCILTGSSLRNFYKNFVLFFVFAFLHIEMTYSIGSRIHYYYSQVEGIVQIVLQLFFFFAIFYHSEDTFFEIPQLFRKENKFINVLYLFAFADSLTTVVHILGSFMFSTSVMWHKGIESLFVCFVVVFVHKYYPKIYLFRLFARNHKIKYFVIHSYLMLSVLYYMQQTEGQLIIIVGCFVIVSLNVYLIYYEYSLDKKETSINQYETYLPVIEELIANIRSVQHSYKNLVQSILSLPATCEDYDSLIAELQKYGDYQPILEEDSNLLKMNMKLVAGLLLSKRAYAKSQHKQLSIQNDVNLSSKLPEQLWIELIGIFVDNAIEAVCEEDIIFLAIHQTQDKIHLTIKNKGPIVTDEMRNTFFAQGYTSKKKESEKHGLGLPRAKTIVTAYKGELILSNERKEKENYIVFEVEV